MKNTLKKTLSVAIIPLMLLTSTACSKKEEVVEDDTTVVVEHEFNSKEAFKEDDGSDIAVLVGSNFDISDYYSVTGYSYSYDGKVDTKTIGEYKITVKAIDSYGSTGTLEKTVQVVSSLDAQSDLDALDSVTTYKDNSKSSTSSNTFTSNNKRYAYTTETSENSEGKTTTTVVVKSGPTETPANTGLADSETGSVTDSGASAGSVSRSDIVVDVKDYKNGTSNMTQVEIEEAENRHNADRDTTTTDKTVEGSTQNDDGSYTDEEASIELQQADAKAIEESTKAVADEEASASPISLTTRTVGTYKSDVKSMVSGTYDESSLDKTNAGVAKALEYVGKEYSNFGLEYEIGVFVNSALGRSKSSKTSSYSQIGDVIRYIDENGEYFHSAIYLGNGLALHSNWDSSKTGIGPVEIDGATVSNVLRWS